MSGKSVTFAFVLILASISLAQTTQSTLEQRLDALRAKAPEFKKRIDSLRSQNQDVSYPMVGLTVIDNFTNFTAEDLKIFSPDAWGWQPVNGDESNAMPDTTTVHSGQVSMKITNKSPQKPNVYGSLLSGGIVSVKQGKPYTFSCWVKTDDPGNATLVAGAGWQFRVNIPKQARQWTRVELKFTPGKDDLAFQPRLISESETAGLWVDDFCLVEGTEAEHGKNLITNPSFEDSWTRKRAASAIGDMEQIAERLDRELRAYQSGKQQLPRVPRWTGTERPHIVGPSFVGPTKSPGAQDIESRPIFFIGYGHFVSARKTIPIFPDYGVNIIQCGEWGPSAIFPKEGVTDDKMIKQTLAELDAGAKAGVAVDLLISPHYFPAWMFQKYPEMRKRRADFFPYSIYSPQLKPFMKEFAKVALQQLKDKPALLSICLSNEPINVEDTSDNAIKAWRAWLEKYHGNIETLNDRWGLGWGQKYGSFAEVPYPDPWGPSNHKRPSPVWMDWVRFNQEEFAAFHKMLADAVHDVAPNIPVHAKATTWHFWRAEQIQGGDDATLFAGFSDIHGNDSVNLYGFGKGAPKDAPVERGNREFAQGWIENALGYDLQRSTKDMPVFDSENHPIFDRETRYVPGEHIRSMLWQGALHGQSATTLWVWERSNDAQGDFAGNIMDRPGCVDALGRTCLDLNRVSREMTALQNTKPAVQILQSFTSAVWDRDYDPTLVKLYTALSFMGIKIGFITERQLEQGVAPTAPVVFVANSKHLSDRAATKLKAYAGHLVFIGNGDLSRNEYDRERAGRFDRAKVSKDSANGNWEALWASLSPHRTEWGIQPPLNIVAVEKPSRPSIQWLTAEHNGALVLNLYNPRVDDETIKIGGVEATDLLTGDKVDLNQRLTLHPLEVRMLEMK